MKSEKTRLPATITAAAATAAAVDSASTGEARTDLATSAPLLGDGVAEALPPAEPQDPPPAVHEWNDEYVGVGGSYVVINGKRVPADQA